MMNDIFSEINSIYSHIQFKAVRWEKDMSSGSVEGNHIQEDINNKLLPDDCSIVILLLYSKIGKFTREEYKLALLKRKKLFVYFKDGFVPKDEMGLENFGNLLRFKSELNQDNRILYKTFYQPNELKLFLYKDLLLYLREQHLLADDSIMKVFQALGLSKTEMRYLECLAMLPLDYYDKAKLSNIFQVSEAEELQHLNEALKSLENKGVLTRSAGKEDYQVQEIIWRNLNQPELYDKEDFARLVDTYIKIIRDITPETATINADQILFTEEFLRHLRTHDRPKIGELKEALSVAYINGFKSQEHLEKAQLLLQQSDDEQNSDASEKATRRKRLLAEVCSALSDTYTGDKKRALLSEARAKLKDIDPSPTKMPDLWDRLRFHYVKFSIEFKLDSLLINQNLSGENPKKRIEQLFADDPAFLAAIKLEPSNLFYNYFILCKDLKASDLAEKIILKLAELGEEEHGAGSQRLYKTYMDCCEISIFNGKKKESNVYLQKVMGIAEKNKTAENPDLPVRVLTLALDRMKKFGA